MARNAENRLTEKIQAGLFKKVLWPICRRYARHLGDRPADGFYRFLCSLQYRRVYGSWPDLVRPRLFSEKLWSRMLHSRDPLLTLICNKLKVRDYVAGKVGADCLVPILWTGKEPEEIPYENLPDQFVIKTNHGSGYNIIVTDRSKLNRKEVANKLRHWLHENFCADKYLGSEWAYRNIDPCIMIESFLGRGGEPPADYKFYCFSGRVELLTLHVNRFDQMRSVTLNRDFERYRFRSDFRQYDFAYSRPSNFDAMVTLAEELSEDFDFMRVDLYSDIDKVYFGELTPYPVGVSMFYSFDISSLDRLLGEKWINPAPA